MYVSEIKRMSFKEIQRQMNLVYHKKEGKERERERERDIRS